MTIRTDEIEHRIGEIQGILLESHYHSSGFVADQIKKLTNLKITFKDFENYTEKAIEIRQEILDNLKLLLKKTLQNEEPYMLEDIKLILYPASKRIFNDRRSNIAYRI